MLAILDPVGDTLTEQKGETPDLSIERSLAMDTARGVRNPHVDMTVADNAPHRAPASETVGPCHRPSDGNKLWSFGKDDQLKVVVLLWRW